jgi:hypothetical protein
VLSFELEDLFNLKLKTQHSKLLKSYTNPQHWPTGGLARSALSGKAFSYVLGTLHLITLSTGQIQSAPMLRRYPDTAYFAHSNYGVEYSLKLPLKNLTSQPQTVTVLMQTLLKDEEGSDRLLFLNPRVEQVFFRGTVKVSYEGEDGQTQTRYVHLVQRRGNGVSL